MDKPSTIADRKQAQKLRKILGGNISTWDVIMAELHRLTFVADSMYCFEVQKTRGESWFDAAILQCYGRAGYSLSESSGTPMSPWPAFESLRCSPSLVNFLGLRGSLGLLCLELLD
jgi:hypothetical protein